MRLKSAAISALVWGGILILANSATAQSNFFKSLTNQDGNISNSLVILENGYAIGGWYNVGGILSSEYYLSILDSNGQLQWSKTYGEKVDKKAQKKHEGGNECFFVHQSMDTGFFLLGEVHGFGAGQSEVYAVKTDQNGDTLWTRTYGSRAVEYCNSAIENSDSGYTIAGFTESFNARVRNAYVLRLNKHGDTIWTKTIGGPSAEAILQIQHTLDNNYILVGSSTSFTNGKSDVFLIKMRPDGSIIWQKVYGGTLNDFGFSITTSTDSGYIISGSTESFGAGQDDVLVLKSNKDGELIWSKTYGGPKFESGAAVTSYKNGFAIIGNTNSFGHGKEDVYLIAIDNNGDTIFTKTVGGEFGDFGTDIKPIGSNVLGITGYSESFFNGASQSILLVTDGNGAFKCGELSTDTEVNSVSLDEKDVSSTVRYGAEIFSPKTLVGKTVLHDTNVCNTVGLAATIIQDLPFTIFPNPSSHQFNIQFSSYLMGQSVIQIFDSKGAQTMAKPILNQHESINHSLNTGLYLVRVYYHDKWYTTRILVD